jgi:bisanhydrobacterioruberin hydratase
MKNTKPLSYLLGSMYLAGIIGLSFEKTEAFFQLITPFHLLSVCFFLIYTHEKINSRFLIFSLVISLLGYLIEVAGVNTGLVFGHYTYLTTLGPNVFGTPPMIGINWFIMIYTTGMLVLSLQIENIYLKSALGAAFMTLFDLIAEPVAIAQNMWNWQNDTPPVQNYVAWFLISFVLLLYFFKQNFQTPNRLAKTVWIYQWLFFGILFLKLI